MSEIHAHAPFTRWRAPIPGLIAATVAVALDQLSKFVIVEKVMRPADRIITVAPVFDLRLSWNSGISFSLFNSGDRGTVAVLLAIQIAITVLLLWWMWRLDRPWLQVACGLIVGGALGNIIDRVTVGAVADFLLFHWGAWEFPTFNIADSCITIGAGMWLLDALILHAHDDAKAGGADAAKAKDQT